MTPENLLTTAAQGLTPPQREAHYGHPGAVLWLTGLSAAGKTSLAIALEQRLTAMGYSCYVLDGDQLRKGLNADLGFEPADRTENVRRAGEVAALFAQAGLVCIAAFISPYREDRARARAACQGQFHEVFVAADLATCEARDPKGLYRLARAGSLTRFTGVSAPYEAPEQPDLTLHTATCSLDTTVQELLDYVKRHVPLRGQGVRTSG